MTQFNLTSILLFVSSLPVNKTAMQVIQGLPQVIPVEVKLAIFLTMCLISYISHRSYLQKKVSLLENTVAELYKAVATLESDRDYMKHIISDMEALLLNCDKKSEFMFTNLSYLQKALYKKLDFEEKYKDGKKEANLTKNRQQAIQEYLTAEKLVSQRFAEV